MLSIYIHIPFCHKKCNYCSFQVCPIDQMKSEFVLPEFEKYTNQIISDIKKYSENLDDKQIKSIYFGGGTPQLIGINNIQKITDTIVQYFDTQDLGEFSIEVNPYPQDEVLDFVQIINKKYRDFSRIRFSFGIQSFENKVLSASNRDITFPGIVDFLRELQPTKKDNNIFNLDFIAFGYFHESKNGNFQLWNPNAIQFFHDLAKSKFVDSYSLYTLELFPGSLRYYREKRKSRPYNRTEQSERCNLNFSVDKLASGGQTYGDQDDIYEEFAILKDILLDSGYKRYEISNFSLLGKSSVHNRVYREMGNYLGLGTSAASFFKNPNEKLCSLLNIPSKTKAVRWTNSVEFPKFYSGKVESDVIPMTAKDLLIEEFFLGLRTDKGINNLSKYELVLASDYKEKIQSYSDQGFIKILPNGIKFTDEGLDIYNDIVTELLDEI